MLGKIESKRRRGQQGVRWLDSIFDSTDMNLSKLRETVEDRGAWRTAVHGVSKSWTRLRDSTTTLKLGYESSCLRHQSPLFPRSYTVLLRNSAP